METWRGGRPIGTEVYETGVDEYPGSSVEVGE